MELDVNNLLSQITQDDRTEKLCKLLTDRSIYTNWSIRSTGQSGLINQIENLTPQATYYDTTDKKIIEPINWTQNPSALAEDEIRQMRDREIGLQAGQNKGATQAGHGGMGNSRHM